MCEFRCTFAHFEFKIIFFLFIFINKIKMKNIIFQLLLTMQLLSIFSCLSLKDHRDHEIQHENGGTIVQSNLSVQNWFYGSTN